jgi:hypothetical protein
MAVNTLITTLHILKIYTFQAIWSLYAPKEILFATFNVTNIFYDAAMGIHCPVPKVKTQLCYFLDFAIKYHLAV